MHSDEITIRPINKNLNLEYKKQIQIGDEYVAVSVSIPNKNYELFDLEQTAITRARDLLTGLLEARNKIRPPSGQ